MRLDPSDVNEACVELLQQILLSDTFDNVSNLNVKDPCVLMTCCHYVILELISTNLIEFRAI